MNPLENTTSDSDVDDPNNITDAASCLDFLKRREVFLYKMMNDPSHKAMLYFLEVLMNSDGPVTVQQLAARFSHKIFSQEMRDACGGGSVEGLRDFLMRYPALFNVHPNDEVTSVAVELPNIGCDNLSETTDSCGFRKPTNAGSEASDNRSLRPFSRTDSSDKCKFKSASTLSLLSSRSINSLNSSPDSHASSLADPNVIHLRRQNGISGDRIRSNAAATNTNLHRRISNPATSGIYQPPALRNLNRGSSNASSCEHCTSTDTCVACPLLNLTCHHCSHHHLHHLHHLHPTSSCCHHVTTTGLDGSGHCQRHCNCASRPVVREACALPPLEKLVLETEAVRFFQQKLLRREERWIQIKSLAGHLSQASAEIRAVVGPQLEFRRFLLRHPHVFEVQGELVSARDAFSSLGVQRRARGFTHSVSNLSSIPAGARTDRNAPPARPKSMILTGSQYVNPLENKRLNESRRSAHFADDLVHSSAANLNTSTPTLPLKDDVVTAQKNDSLTGLITSSTEGGCEDSRRLNSLTISMSLNEYKAVMFLRKSLQQGMTLSELIQTISEKAPSVIQSTIGWTRVELQEFLNQHTLFFQLECSSGEDPDGSKTLVRNKRLQRMINIIISGTKPTEPEVRTLTNRCGRIFHVAKLWGIIDLGKHEHVFFDKSIFKHVDDLQRYFKVNELLYFNAILAPKESRAKWRATQVWKECDRENVEKFGLKSLSGHSELNGDSRQFVESKSSGSLALNEDTEADEDIEDFEVDVSSPLDESVAQTEGLHLVKDIRFVSDDIDDDNSEFQLSTTSSHRLLESKSNVVTSSCNRNTSSKGASTNSSSLSTAFKGQEYVSSSTEAVKPTDEDKSLSTFDQAAVSIAVQTLSTGDIMATQLYHDQLKR